MKIRSALFTAVAVTGMLGASAANAGPNFTGSNVDMGFLTVGSFGTITNIYQGLFSIPPNEVAQSIDAGYIPRNSVINFTYHLTSGILAGATTSTSDYNYMLGGNHYNGNSTNVSGFAPVQAGYINGVSGVSQVFATANYTQGAGSATGHTQIANYTGSTVTNVLGYQHFSTTLIALLLQNPQATGYITYNVSSIPLPASFPMMVLAEAGLFGFARMSQQRKAFAA